MLITRKKYKLDIFQMMRLQNRFYLYITEKNNIYKPSKLYLCL